MKKLGLLVSLGIGCAAVALSASPAPAQDKLRIGVSQPNVEHPYRVSGVERAKAWAAQHPGVEMTIVDGRRDSAVQLASLEDLITRRVDVIVLSPNDSAALAPIADTAKRAKIPLVVFDRKLGVAPDDYAAYIGSDNVEMGRVSARFIAERLGGKGKVIQIEGTPGASATLDRKRGFEEEIARHPDMKIVSYVGHYRLHDAVAVMEDAVTAHRDMKAVYAHNDTMALGGAQVLRERGLTGVVTVGMDGAKEGCDGVASGALTGSLHYPTMFPEALELAVKVPKGETVPKNTVLPTPMITAENRADFCK
ncbi:substrate-binding domain-containing protein [Azospirillum melinis]|uniref:substrate-binding domain-containing protein n=1 Tax=Azospirillum melinis TaxID=328839 RepID=UPI0037571F55